MTCVRLLSGPLADAQRAELLFRGELLVFKDVPQLAELRELTTSMVETELEGRDPERPTVGSRLGDDPAGVVELQRRFRREPLVGSAFRGALAQVGVDTERAYWDWLHLRVQLPAEKAAADGGGTLGPHRDTWSSNVYEQTNWWTPIFPVDADRTIAFYPAYWSRPIGNTSAEWDLEAIRARRAGSQGDGNDVPIVPEPSEPVDAASELRLVIEPGDLLCFSAAHLHASVPNTSGRTRFSVEVRTVHVDDVRLGRQAPNLDSRAPRRPLEWFRRIPDGRPLVALDER